MKIYLRFLREYPRESVLAPLFKLLEACFDLCVPLVVAAMIDRGIGTGDTGFLWKMTLLLVLLAFVGLACSVTAQYFASKAAVGTATQLRRELFAHMQAFTYAQTDRVGTASMITRMTSDINQLQTGINITLRLLLRSPIIVFGAVAMAFTVSVRLAWIFVGVVPLLALVVFGVMLGTIPLYRKVQARLPQEKISTVRALSARSARRKRRFAALTGSTAPRPPCRSGRADSPR